VNGQSIVELEETDNYPRPQECWEHLQSADADNDGSVGRDEYLQFAILEAPGLIDMITRYPDLPLAYQLAYTTISCFCKHPVYGDPDDIDCCVDDPTIRVPNAPGDSPSSSDIAYLNVVCALTDAAADTIIRSPGPTSETSKSPSIVQVPSPAPSSTQTLEPTQQPITSTESPTTSTPTIVASKSPTTSPTYSITNQPTTSTPTATVSTIVPTLAPNSAPQVNQPTLAPIVTIVESNATVTYNISIRDGVTRLDSNSFVTDYLANLISGLNQVAKIVVEESQNGPADRRRLRNHVPRYLAWFTNNKRFLQSNRISLKLPSTIQHIREIDCPSGTMVPSNEQQTGADITLGPTDVCQEITAVVTLVSNSSGSNIESDASQFGTELFNAIYDGDLQDVLNAIYISQNSSPDLIVILTGYIRDGAGPPIQGDAVPNIPPMERSSNTLSPGAISAITLGAMAVALVPIALFLSGRARREEEEKPPDYQEYQPDEADVEDSEIGGQRTFRLPDGSVAGSQYTDFAVKSTSSLGGAVGATTLGAAQTDYGKAGHSSKKVIETMMLDEVDDAEVDTGTPENDSSSNAGSSGWSSSAGISSLNTGSIDDSADIAAAAGATLAGIGLASATFRQQHHQRATAKSDIETDDDSITDDERKDTEVVG
jgi:hypothetical protein